MRSECLDSVIEIDTLHPEEIAVVVETHKEIMNKMVGKSINSQISFLLELPDLCRRDD